MTIESEINEQYQDFFKPNAWLEFKFAADYYLNNAAMILKKDIKYSEEGLTLLFRNIQKRLYIGIACELLLKAIYLKNGYVINKRINRDIPPGKSPFLFSCVDQKDFSINKTLTFNDLIQKLSKIIDPDENKNIIEKGLRIAKVFRNKEGHLVSLAHDYAPQNYRDIEESLKYLYQIAFNEKLFIFIAFGENEVGQFKIIK